MVDLQIKCPKHSIKDDSPGNEIYNSFVKNEACKPAKQVKTNLLIETSGDSGRK